MKKIRDILKYKWFQRKRSLAQLKRREHYNEWRRARNKREQGIPHRLLKRQHENRNAIWFYNKISAPKIFSFINNTEEIVKFIREIENLYENRKRVWVVLRNIEEIDYSAIVVLLSIMVKFKASKIPFNGDFPKSARVNDILMKSGFFENLARSFKNEESYELSQINSQGIHTHAKKTVDSKLSSDIIDLATEMIWGEKRRCQGVQRALIELMHNTNNHAEIGKKGEKHWWLSVRHNEEKDNVCFAFVDFGVGVFKSLDNKPNNSKWFNWAIKLKKKIQYGNNSDIFKLIMNGDFHKIVTERYYRGKGLPGIAEVQKRNQMSNLRIVTNDVNCSFDEDKYEKMKTPFSGTFIYWELSRKNESCR